MAWVNTVMDSDGNSKIGTEAQRGQASLGDRDSKRVVTNRISMPEHIGITECSTEKKSGPQGRG
jgi:hypothetical protein